MWTENPAEHTAGGVYLFVDKASADEYIAFHSRRLASFGITDINAAPYDVNEALKAVTHASLVAAR